jgi:hypothetical protein
MLKATSFIPKRLNPKKSGKERREIQTNFKGLYLNCANALKRRRYYHEEDCSVSNGSQHRIGFNLNPPN